MAGLDSIWSLFLGTSPVQESATWYPAGWLYVIAATAVGALIAWISGRRIAERDRGLVRGASDYRLLLWTIHSAVIVHGPDTAILMSNPLAQELLGLTEDQMMGRTAMDPSWHFFREDGSVMPSEEYPVNRVFATGKPLRDLVVGVHRSDQAGDIWALVNADPVRGDNNEIARVIVTFADITDRKRAEAERQAHLKFLESLDRINRVMQTADDLEQMMSDTLDAVLDIFEGDRAFLMVPCDPGAEVWRVPMERTRPEYPGVLALGLEMPMDPDVAQTLRILLASDGPVKFGPGTDYPLPPDVSEQFGFRCFMSMAIHPRIGSPWQFGIHQCSYARIWTDAETRLFRDIGRRLADGLTGLLSYRNLQESENRYRLVFENSPVSIWEEDFSAVKTLLDGLRDQGITDIEGYFVEHPEIVSRCAELVKIVDVNRAAVDLHGAANKEELLSGLVRTFTPASFDAFREELVCIWKGSLEMSQDAIVRTFAGEIRNVTVSFSVCPGYEDTLSRVIVSLVNITDRMLAEAEIRRLNQELEQRVRDRTAQLEAANRELEGLAYSVSHDLRAPLRHIDAFIHLLDKRVKEPDEQMRHYMSTISAAARRMGRLIDDLLSFMRMGRVEMAKGRVDLGALVQEVLSEFSPETKDRVIHWNVGDLPIVPGDRSMLRIVLENLIGNALKFTRTREDTIIEIACLSGSDGDAVIYIKDNGVGFDSRYASKLFGVFERLHGIEEFEGTGIGLANVQRIVARHGGRAWAEGEIDRGATFYFSVPVTWADDAKTTVPGNDST